MVRHITLLNSGKCQNGRSGLSEIGEFQVNFPEELRNCPKVEMIRSLGRDSF